MFDFDSPSPKRRPFPSSTPAPPKPSPNSFYHNNSLRHHVRSGKVYSARLNDISPVTSTQRTDGRFLSSDDRKRHDSPLNGDIIFSPAYTSAIEHCSSSKVLDKLANDHSVVASHLRDCLAFCEELGTPENIHLNEQSSPTSGSPATSVSMRTEFRNKLYRSLKHSIESDVTTFVECREICPDVINVQANNVFLERIGENENDNTQELFNTVLDSDRITSSYVSIAEISITKFACVYRARHRFTSLLHCLKRSLSESMDHHIFELEALNEVNALALVEHPNIVRYFDSWRESGCIILATEFCLGGSLFHYLHPSRAHASLLAHHDNSANGSVDDLRISARRLPESALIHLFCQITSALQYLHTNWNIVHGDVKPSNILIQLPDDNVPCAYASDELVDVIRNQCVDVLQSENPSQVVFKLSDFGRASRAGDDREGEDLGDGRYLPSLDDSSSPECTAFGRDIYALGVTLYHSAGGVMEFSILDRFRAGGFTFDDASVLPQALRSIVMTMLSRNARDRPTSTSLLGHFS